MALRKFSGMKSMLPNKKSRFKQGFLKLKNPNKYVGDINKVIYRSGLERDFYIECDNDQRVVKWVAEPAWLEVKYMSPKDGKIHRYFPDVYCEKIVDGKLIKFIIEVKPLSKTKPPKIPNLTIISPERQRSVKRKYEKLLLEHNIIIAKRNASTLFASRNGFKYLFLTERYIKRQISQK